MLLLIAGRDQARAVRLDELGELVQADSIFSLHRSQACSQEQMLEHIGAGGRRGSQSMLLE
jgi:hypothetical protein